MRAMRIARLAALTAAVVVANAAPSSALTLAPPTLRFTPTPTVGPNQSTISVQGLCTSGNSGSASLRFPTRSDALRPPLDSKPFAVNSDGTFKATLGVNFAASFPVGSTPPELVDLEVAVSCGSLFQRQAFTMTDRGGTNPTIFTVLGDGACGLGLAPTEAEARIPCPRHVKGLTPTGGFTQANFYAQSYSGQTYTNGGTVAVGHFDRDFQLDIVTGTLPGSASAVTVASQKNEHMLELYPYGDFTGGVNVAVADVNGDGRDDIITAAGPGGGPHVKVTSEVSPGMWADIYGFYAYEPGFTGGVTVAAADLDGDGKAEIVTGPGPGGGPHVRAFKGDGTPLGGGFMAYDPAFHGGVFVAAGKLGTTPSIVTGPGPGGGPHVRAFNSAGAPNGGGFMAYSSAFGGGVAVALGQAGIVTVPAKGGGPHVRTFVDAHGSTNTAGFMAYDIGNTGLRIAAAR